MAAAVVGPGISNRNVLAGQERRSVPPTPEPGVLVQGVVRVHETGEPIAGAAVSIAQGSSGTPGRGTRITDDEGKFLFRDVPPGSYRLYVTIQGYRRMNDTLQVSAEGDLDLILPLSIDPIGLEPIIVRAQRRVSPAKRGFEARRRNRAGFLVTREEIEKRRPRYLTELLNRVPGGIVLATPPHGYTLLLRGQCLPGVWVDGVRVRYVESIDQLLSPMDVEAVEVFHGFDLPAEFGVDVCGGVLIWTRTGPQFEGPTGAGPKAMTFSRLFMAASLALLGLLIIR